MATEVATRARHCPHARSLGWPAVMGTLTYPPGVPLPKKRQVVGAPETLEMLLVGYLPFKALDFLSTKIGLWVRRKPS